MMIRGAAAMAAAVVAFGFVSSAEAQTPKRGGILNHYLTNEPPNLDCHQSQSIFLLGVVRPVYSNLVRFDPLNYPTIAPDIAESWTVAPDGLTYTFKIRTGVKFHDGSTLSAADVKASFDRIKTPPQGVPSIRQRDFGDVSSVEAPDATTVVFKLSQPNAAMMDLIANPYNCIYSARKLQENPTYPVAAPMGTGPFEFIEWQKGAFASGKRFDSYYRPNLPYLDGYKTFFISPPAYVSAISTGQLDMSLRGLQPPELASIKAQLGDKVVTDQTSVLNLETLVSVNHKRKPFDDVRVRRALALAVDHRGSMEGLRRITNQQQFGGILRPGYEMATADPELAKLPGFGPDINAARAEARRLLAEAGQSNLRAKLLNQNTGAYAPMGTFIVSQWQQIGVNIEQDIVEAAQYQQRYIAGDFDLLNEVNQAASDDPTLMLIKWTSGAGNNFTKLSDPLLDDLFKQQKATTDRAVRKRISGEFEKQVLEQGYMIPLFWAGNTPAWRTYVHNWKSTSNFNMSYDLTEVWMDK